MMMMKRLIVGIVVLVCACGIVAFFWKTEMKYSLPTPVPSNYRAVPHGQQINLTAAFRVRRAYFLHFYNPDCPCSRFNGRHLKSLIRQYADSVQIVIVVPSTKDIAKAREELGDDLEIRADNDDAIAKACGVYSTPQAVIIDSQGRLYYRGNYNRVRYCTTRASNFAELSLIAFLNKQPAPSFGILATESYGCSLEEARSGNNDIEFF